MSDSLGPSKRGRGRAQPVRTVRNEAPTAKGLRGRGRAVPRRHAEASHNVGGDGMSNISFSSRSSSDASVGSDAYVELRRIMPRPGLGSVGRKIDLRANYYPATINGSIKLHQYRIDISRVDLDRVARFNRDRFREIFFHFYREFASVFGTVNNLIYDDAQILWSRVPLNIPERSPNIPKHVLEARFERGTYRMEIQYVGQLELDVSNLDGINSTALSFLNLLFSQSVRCLLKPTSSSFYYFAQTLYMIPRQNLRNWVVDLGGGLEAWTGLHGAVKVGQGGRLFYNADAKTTAFVKLRENLIDFYVDVLNEFKGVRSNKITVEELCKKGERLTMDDNQRRMLTRALTGVILTPDYGNESNRSRRLRFLKVGAPARTERFLWHHGTEGQEQVEEVTVEEFFRRYHGVRLTFPYLPTIQMCPRRRSCYIPMELLVTADKPQKVRRNLSEFQRARLIKNTVLNPSERIDRIVKIMESCDFNSDEFLTNYGVSLTAEFVSLQGRVLPPPSIEMNSDDIGKKKRVDVENGLWTQNRLTKCPEGIALGAIIIDESIDSDDLQTGCRAIISRCKELGLSFRDEGLLVQDWDTRDNMYMLPTLIEDMNSEVSGDRKLLIIFVPKRKDDFVYSYIKKICDLEIGVPSQVILVSTMRDIARKRSIPYNLTFKINLKLNGVNNRIYPDYRICPKFFNPDDPTLFIGIDVCHKRDFRTSEVGDSIAAIIGSEDVYASRYGATIKVLDPGQEHVDSFGEALTERLIAFRDATERKPAHIVIFRDGISESEFDDVMKRELLKAETKCKKLDEYNPTFTYIVVQKRHHTRLFVEKQADARGCGNVPPGTVVDECITSDHMFDYFLASHLGALGTSRPCHYYVLHDGWKLSADDWQQLAFALCHLYGRCSRSVSIPAPVYYAHLACNRAMDHYNAVKDATHLESMEPAAKQRELQKLLKVHGEAPVMYFV